MVLTCISCLSIPASIEEALAKPEAGNLETNLGSLFKRAMQKDGEGPDDAQ